MTATYRLQLHAGFTFADAEDLVPYLADLGVSHLYLSPVLQAVPGSAHGYDVVDHTRISSELGGLDGLERLAATARADGLGLVVDVVPNHMALVAPESTNRPLWDVLAHGRQAAHAHWFDVDWDALDGRIGLPVLWEPIQDVLAQGDLRLGEENGERVIRYHDHVFPVAEDTWDGAADADVVDVLARQHYRLAGWRERDTVLNYRRFFDVDSLIAVRVEEPDVFEATHSLLLDLNQRGLVEGFRIDHPDGLADPGGYLHLLRSQVRPGTAVWVEKILEGDERLPDWACDGTTGYDAAKAVSAALVDRATAPALTHAWVEAGGTPRSSAWSRRPSAASSSTSSSRSDVASSGGPAPRCPTPTRTGSTRRWASCWSRARSTAPTSVPGTPRTSSPAAGCRRRSSAPPPPGPISGTSWTSWSSWSSSLCPRPPTTSRSGFSRPGAR